MIPVSVLVTGTFFMGERGSAAPRKAGPMLSTKTREHIRRRFARIGPRLAALGAGGVSLAAALVFLHNTMRVVEITDTKGASGTVITCATNVNDLIVQAGVTVPNGEDELRITEADGADRIHVLRAFTVPVTVDGQTLNLVTADETVGELLQAAGVLVGEHDFVQPALDTPLKDGDTVTIQRVTYDDYTAEEVVPVETEYEYSSLYYRNTDYEEVLEAGSEGLDQVTYRDVYVDGEWVETQELSRTTLTPMQPAVLKCYGEGAPVSIFTGPEVVDGVPSEGVTQVYTGQRSTGYSASSSARGASGQKLTYGTVAVNPNIIPYGTLLYITSDDGRFVYGYAYAADTGTALMTGHAFVDLYYETYAESVTSAVIPVTVYVIDDEVAAQYEEANDAIREADLADHHG